MFANRVCRTWIYKRLLNVGRHCVFQQLTKALGLHGAIVEAEKRILHGPHYAAWDAPVGDVLEERQNEMGDTRASC